ncbi:MAG: serine hydrolase domain-containing protein, partial [Gemmataceae bacterium]
MYRSLLLMLTVMVLSSGPLRADDPPAAASLLAGLDAEIRQAMTDQDVPGLSVAVVKDGQVVLLKGYGVQKLGEAPAVPVTEKTVFAIGSCTKAFTATALAFLVEEKKLNWDDNVTKHMPKFQLHDPYVTREITVRDLLCHRSGLERHELMWYGAPYSREQIVERLRLISPDSSFRSEFGYQNMM